MTIAALMLSGLSSYDRAKAAVETWLGDFDFFEIHSFAPSEKLPVTSVGLREGPRSCFEKRLRGLDRAVRLMTRKLDWYLCCSDDNYFWRENLERWLDRWEKYSPPDDLVWNPQRPMLVGGHTNKLRIHDGTRVIYPSGGAGYCLNRSALELVVTNLPELRDEWARRSNHDDIEDAFIGWAAARLSIPYFETPGFYGCNPGIEGVIERRACERGCVSVERPISFHYITAEQMLMLRKSQTSY